MRFLPRPFSFWTLRRLAVVTYTPSTRFSFNKDIAAATELRKIPTSTPSPRPRPRAGDWRVDTAETMDRMFYGASAFDQDLGWCTLATVDRAFHTTPCQSRSGNPFDCGVLRGVRAEEQGALGACEPEKTPAPTPDPEGRVCNGGPYDGRRCDRHDFCQQPDPTQPDVDACDDCKCITRKDSDGAARTSAGGCFVVFFFFLGVLGFG